MRDYNHSAKTRANHLSRHAADQFETALVHNMVAEAVDGQHDHDNMLLRALHVAEEAYDLSDDAESDTLDSAAFGAATTLDDQIDNLVAQLTAEACGVVCNDANDWGDVWDDDVIEAAQAEARQWLETHPDAAAAAGVCSDIKVVDE